MSLDRATRDQSFVRRTSLQDNEYRTNFRQIDSDVIAALISEDASKVTPLMSKIYLTLVSAPPRVWEREGVLRLIGCEREGKWLTAWEQLVEMVGVASATARKAFGWMSQQGIIGYHAGKNGVGIRIFINRAASSIGRKPDQSQKNLRLVPASFDAPRTSANEVPFKESFAVLDSLDPDFIPQAPKTGAAKTNTSSEYSDIKPASATTPEPRFLTATRALVTPTNTNVLLGAEVVERITREIAPMVKAAAAQEQERTRQWFINQALPKAIRVAQASAYDVLRAHGVINGSPSSREVGRVSRSRPDNRHVGKNKLAKVKPGSLSDREIAELAEGCVTLLHIQGQAIECTLSGMSIEAGGFLSSDDAAKVRAKAEDMTRVGAMSEKEERQGDV